MKKIYWLLFGVFFLSAISLQAQDDDIISPERPGFTNPPSIVPRKSIQIESGFYFESDKDKNTNIKTDLFFYPTTLFRYGLLKNVELRLQIDIAGISNSGNGSASGSVSGLNPVIISTKVYMSKEKKPWPESAILFALLLPYFSKEELRAEYPAPIVGFNFENTLNKKLSLGYTVGLVWNGYDANPKSYITISPTYNFTKKIAGFIELYSFFQNHAVPDDRLDVGLTYTPLKNLQMDVYGGPGIAGPTTNYFISAGIAFRLPK